MNEGCVVRVVSQKELDTVFEIRRKVFVEEQLVPANEEYDEWENTSRHFLAYDIAGNACGTARWRLTDKGIKLERFAVLPESRSCGIGQALVLAVVQDIEANAAGKDATMYLHAQLPAQSLYSRFGFKAEGDEFEECGIKHYLMKKKKAYN